MLITSGSHRKQKDSRQVRKNKLFQWHIFNEEVDIFFSLIGFSGVIRQDLNHLLIPNGWRLGGLVSNHCPVWAELTLAP